MKVATYSRVSTSEQSDSVRHQLSILHKYCNEHNYEYDDYIDTGISGTGFSERKDFLRLLKECKVEYIRQYDCFTLVKGESKYDKIICKSSSRFGRNLDSIKLLQLLNKQNIQVVFIEDGQEISNMLDPSTQLIASVNAVVNANFSIQNSQRVKHGMIESAKEGIPITSNSIYGYDYDIRTKTLTVIPHQAEVIKFIFNSYKDGLGYKRIADTLNKQGHRTKKGTEFNAELIRYILQNEKYAGLNVRNKFSKSKLNGDTRAKVNNKEDWIVTNNIPGIISVQLFNEVQHIRDNKTAKTRGKYRGKSILASKIICSQCGYNYVMNKDIRKTGVYPYYICWAKKTKRKQYCSNQNIYLYKLEDLLDSTFVNSLVFRNKHLRIQSIVTSINDINHKLSNKSTSEVDGLRLSLNRLQGNKSKLLDLLLSDTITKEDYEFKLAEINDNIANINTQLKQQDNNAEVLQGKLHKLKQLHERVLAIPVDKHYTFQEICDMVQSIKVDGNELKVAISVNNITFTEVVMYQ